MTEFSSSVEIDGVRVGAGARCYVIAEAGVAHFGSLEKAFALVDLAADAGADAVKFQIFRAEDMISGAAADWRRRMASRELPYEAFAEIQAHARSKGITFFATAHDLPSLEFLDGLDVPAYKVGSGEVGNWPFVRAIAARGKPVIISTGMYDMEDVEAALEVLSDAGNPDVAVLHCVTQYPVPPQDVDLNAIAAIAERFGVIAGYSDHTRGTHIPLAAVAMGAKVLEKHIALDFDVPDAQDWKVSCGPDDLPHLVREVREIEAAFGSGRKAPVSAERQAAEWARKSLVAAATISAGTPIAPHMLTAKRPGSGIAPFEASKVVGRTAARDIAEDTIIGWDDLL